jgi:hypothetical protein
MSPSSARLRKQIRQIPNFRYTARGRPQILHRRSWRVVNLGVRSALAILDLLAMQFCPLLFSPRRRDRRWRVHAALSGNPSLRSSSRAS